MTDRLSAPDRKATRAAVRDRLFAVARQYQTLSVPDLQQQLAPLHRQAASAGFHIVAGLTRALDDTLTKCPCRECAPVFLQYMTRALTLEPSSDRAILNLLLGGVQRRLAEVRHHCQQVEA